MQNVLRELRLVRQSIQRPGIAVEWSTAQGRHRRFFTLARSQYVQWRLHHRHDTAFYSEKSRQDLTGLTSSGGPAEHVIKATAFFRPLYAFVQVFHLIILLTVNVIVWNFRKGMAEADGGQGGARPPSYFVRSVNPISTGVGGGQNMHPTLLLSPHRFSYLPPSL